MTDFASIDRVMRLVNRELWIVTAADSNRRGGLLATWVSQASIDDRTPIVVAGIGRNHFTAELIDAGGAFALHLLTAEHLETALTFAIGSGRSRDKLGGLDSSVQETGSPILSDCLAWLDCRVFARLEAGDRIYYWADVLAGETRKEGIPATERDLIAFASDEQRLLLRASRLDDVASQRTPFDKWRSSLPNHLAMR